ncbi:MULTISPECIES: YtxH domain-containing protein [Deinococcus]|nr:MULTISPECIES: YtxH domain-containing protein [Deinococcus]MBI0446646.1 YtxH domain-containing protein [Deinococcus sp. DB0503]TDE85888.1 YtxH domain-containing protein [Deinococcus sp. S9]
MTESSNPLTRTLHATQNHLDHRLVKESLKKQAQLEATVTRQQADIARLDAQVKHLQRARSSGMSPWTLLLAAGGLYALYRTNPTFRNRVQRLVHQVFPGVEGNLARAADAAKDAVQDLAQGEDPRSALRDAGRELRHAGEKVADRASDKVQDLKEQAQDTVQSAKRDGQNWIDRAADQLGDLKEQAQDSWQDLKRSGEQTANDIKRDLRRS